MNDDNISLTHRTKLVKVQDSLLSQEENNLSSNPELTVKELKHKFREPTITRIGNKGTLKKNKQNQKNLLLLHEQKFHPELTGRYNFKEGKHSIITNEKEEQKISRQQIIQIDEIIGPKSFVPIMILGKGSFGEVYLVQK